MKKLFICLFFSCIAVSDPLSYFAKNDYDNISVNDHVDTEAFVRQIEYRNNRVYVVWGKASGQGVVSCYDNYGKHIKSVEMVYLEQPIDLEAQMQVLWGSGHICIPGTCNIEGRNTAVVQKYNYSLELQTDFGEGGTFTFSDSADFYSFASVTAAGGLGWAGGFIKTQEGEAISSVHLLIAFDLHTGEIKKHYKEADFVVGGTRSFNYIKVYHVNDHYYMLGLSSTKDLFYVPLTQNSRLSLDIQVGIPIDNIAFVNHEGTHLYGVDNTSNTLNYIEIYPGSTEIYTVLYPHPITVPSYIFSMEVVDKHIYLGGAQQINTHPLLSTPFVERYNISNPRTPVKDTTFFDEGRWGINGLISSLPYKGFLKMLTSNPHSFLISLQNILIHGYSTHGFYNTVTDLSQDKFAPFLY